MFGVPIAHYAFGDIGFGLSDPLFELQGNSSVEFAPTITFIVLIEAGQGLMSFSADIELRSL